MAFKIALLGNPNCGKTTLFNNLTGSNQYVGNWPGVTVEKKEGFLKGNEDIKIVDLPGIYSLTPYTDEEIVSRNYLFFEKPDLILNVVSGTNLERSLYLTLQLLETGIPLVVVVGMMDKVKKSKNFVNCSELAKMLNCEVVKTRPNDSSFNISMVLNAVDFAKKLGDARVCFKYSTKVEKHIEDISNLLEISGLKNFKQNRFMAIKFLEQDSEFIKCFNLEKDLVFKIEKIVKNAVVEFNEGTKSVTISEKYDFIEKIINGCCKNFSGACTMSDKIDAVLTNKILAIPIFVLILGSVYYFCINILGRPMSNFMEFLLKANVTPFFKRILEMFNVSGWFKSLVLEGILSGVGTVLTFIPQVFMLFLFLSVLEDCGYMARVAFILDYLFLKFGLCGKSVISFLVSSGCGVNGIMATKTIKNESSRFLTVVTTTFIPCNAKIPIIAVICSYIFNNSLLAVFLVYFLCIFAIFILSLILKKFKSFSNSDTNFIMELGPYIMPNLKNTIYYTVLNVKSFITKAGTVIFLASVFIWFLLNFGFSSRGFGFVAQENSFLAQFGKFLTGFFVPLGFGNWQAVVATMSGIFAKENVVNTFGVILKSAQKTNEEFSLQGVFSGNFAALSFLIFNMLCAPCFAAIATIYKQTLSFKFTLKIIFFQTVCAYVAGLLIYQIGGLIFGEVKFNFCSVLAFFVLFFIIFLMFCRNKAVEKRF